MNLSDIRISSVDPEKAFKIFPDIDKVEQDPDFFEKDYEVEEVDLTLENFTNNFYLFPCRFVNNVGDSLTGYALVRPWYDEISRPYYTIRNDNKLVDVDSIDCMTGSRYISVECIVDKKFLQNKSLYASLLYQGDTSSLIPWADFRFNEIVPNVGYQFQLIGREEEEYDPDEIKNEKIITGEMDPDDSATLDDCYIPIWGLERTELYTLPTEGFWWYLPVNIIFNEKQSILGYALFDAEKHEVIDLHFWNEQYGQVSAMYGDYENSKLQDCGFFKDVNQFRYEMLLGPFD